MIRFPRVVLIGILLGLLTVAGLYGWEYYRGAWTAFRPPSADIADLLRRGEHPLALPDGFLVSVFAEVDDGPRDLLVLPDHLLLASVPSSGDVWFFADRDDNGVADGIDVPLQHLSRPHGLAASCTEGHDPLCTLYVAEEDRLLSYEYQPLHSFLSPTSWIGLPRGGQHRSRSLLLLPDGQLLVSIGSTCNACDEEDPLRGAVSSANIETKTISPSMIGLRNSVFLTQRPGTDEIWATEMGRDYLGDDLPPDEVNVLRDGQDYGWPECYGQNVVDTTVVGDRGNPCAEPERQPSRIDLPAHSAPLGLAFVPNGMGWPADYVGDLLVAYHGSWNRTEPTGYKVVRIQLDADGRPGEITDFITGWLLPDGGVLGRPVDLTFASDGALYISDDKANVIYRVVSKL